MTYCKFCEQEQVESWFGNWCTNCRQIKNLCNVYGFPRTLEILKKCCIRDESQLERKIEKHKKLATIVEEGDESYEKPNTRGKKSK